MCRWEELTLYAPDPSRTSSAQDDVGFGVWWKPEGFREVASFGRLTAGGGSPHMVHVGLEGYDDYGDCGQGC